MFGSAVTMQALLSASNLIIGLILIRRTTDLQFGYYILILNTLLLLTALQGAFIGPPMVIRMVSGDTASRAELIGGLYRGQRQVLLPVGIVCALGIASLGITQLISGQMLVILFAGLTAALASFYREFFRMVLKAHRRPTDVLKADALYVVVLIPGAMLATVSPAPAAFAVLSLSLASVCGGAMLSRSLWRYEPWNPAAATSVLMEMAPLGGWSTAGSAAHWAFSQGYNYVVAGALDVPAVAALGAIRLLMMPVNLLSSGIGSLMLPTASNWLRDHAAAVVFRRLVLIACALAVAALMYFATLWLLRDWILERILHKHFAHADALLAIWSMVFVIMVFRDQLIYLPGACGMFKALTATTGVSAVISLSVGYIAIRRLGVIGAPLGVLVGELSNLFFIVVMSLRRVRT
jgi:O-antigen/teichoic acid export membrane protein